MNRSTIGARGGTPTPGNRRWIYWVAALVIAGLAGFLALRWVSAAAPRVEVVVAAREIPPNSVISPEDLKVEARPTSGLPADAVLNIGDVAGMLAKGHLLTGDVVRAGHAVAREGGPLSAVAEQYPDQRIISLGAELAEGLFAQLKPGDRIDVLGVLQVQTDKVNETRIGVLAGGVPIVAIEQPKSGGALTSESGGSLLLAVAPEQSQAIKLAQAAGKLFVQLTTAPADAPRPPILTPQSILATPEDQVANQPKTTGR